MTGRLTLDREAIGGLCRKHGVRSLVVFGSALSEQFDDTRSDVDSVTGRSWPEYQVDVMLRSAVARQFEIIGESLNRLRRTDPVTAAGIEDLPRIVAFRNVLVHGYANIDDSLVWEVATTRIDPLIATLNRLMDEAARV
jgi:uncharacterized protein with HEPN domain